MLEYYIKTSGPKSHIQVCELISIMGLEILDSGFADPGDGTYYAFFKIKSDPQAFEIFSGFIGIKLEISPDRTLR